jgi:hypothetical protein
MSLGTQVGTENRGSGAGEHANSRQRGLCQIRDDVEMDDAEVECDNWERHQARPVLKPIRIRLFPEPRGWRHSHELDYQCEPNGDVNLVALAQQLPVEGVLRVCSQISGRQQSNPEHLQVIDPRNFRPFYQYVPGVLKAHDVKSLLENNYLRVAVL